MKICGFTVVFLVYGGVLLAVHAYMDYRFAGIFLFGSLSFFGVIFGYMCQKKTRDQKKYEGIISQLQKNVTSCEHRQSELYFSRSPLAVIEWSADFIVQSWNKKAEEIFGYTAEEMIGQHASKIIPKQYQDKAMDVMTTILTHDESRQDIFKNFTKDGKEIYCEWFNTPIADACGHLTVYSLVQDITRKQRVEIALRENERKLDDIFNALHDMVYVIESDGIISYANSKSYDLLGIPVEEYGTVHFSQLLDEEEQKIAYKRIEILLTVAGRGITPQIYHLKKRGSSDERLPVEIITVPFKENGIKKVLGVARPISERLELDRERARSQRMHSISILAGGVAHDFNNLLMAISGNAYLMMHGGKETVEKYCEKILFAVDRATGLTQQLSSLAKGGTSIKQVTHISDVVQQTKMIIGDSTQSCFTFDFEESLKPCVIDQRKIGQVFQNLFINASHAMPGGGIIHVTGENVVLEEDNQFLLKSGIYVHVSVRDSGTGIAEKYLSRIFEPYFTTKSVGEGTGLGLYVAYSIIKEHGGYIGVKSKAGVGTTFHIYLPATDLVVEQELEFLEEEVLENHLSILAVDDMEINRELLAEMSRAIGHACDVAADGREGLVLYKKAMEAGKRYDLVITDLTIPGGMGGEEFIEELRKIHADVIVIVSSGYSDHMPENVSGSLPKPFSFQAMQTVIRRAMIPVT